MKRVHIILLLALFGSGFLSLDIWGEADAKAKTSSPGCSQPGWFPPDIDLKDHSVFVYDGFYYIVSIYAPGEKVFAYARSNDFCDWEELSPVLGVGLNGDVDETAIWAPHVISENGTYYMYYTGVNRHITQRIMLAVSTNPADPSSWQKVATNNGFIFQPDHPGMVWEEDLWADCRDPMVIKASEGITTTYYMYYSGRDIDGGIVGVATASSPEGPWEDQGRVTLLLSSSLANVPESPTVIFFQENYYLFYNDTAQQGSRFQISKTPDQFLSDAFVFKPGWAHEVWQDVDGNWYTSYLVDRNVYINKLSWFSGAPPIPVIADVIYSNYLPYAQK